MDEFRDAWEALYRGQARPWRGVADIGWMRVSPGDRVLELGCGNGKTCAALYEKGAEVTGIDFSESAIASCERLLQGKGVFKVADVRNLPFGDGSFDTVVSVHVIEHVPASDFPQAVSEILRVLREGGTFYLKVFAEGDMRSDGKKEDIRNGILYRYFSEEDVRSAFAGFDIISIEHVDEPTRFGTVRRRLECVIRRR